VAWQGAHDVAVLNLDDPTTLAIHTGATSLVRGFSLSHQPRHGGFLDADGRLVLTDGDRRTPLLAANELRVPGRHNIANALAAAIVGGVFDIPPDVVGEELRGFEGVSRRLETVAEKDGVLWVNDSAATTPDATIKALDAFDRPAVVILGGVGKGADFAELSGVVVKRARAAVLIGKAADEIASALDAAGAARAGIHVERADTLEAAVAAARRLAQPGDVVLLSPACASFDMFSSADERGDRFTALVRAFTEPVRS
jgi:UDP-N-acetylmuramoylalanine--D-glutamate ligase